MYRESLDVKLSDCNGNRSFKFLEGIVQVHKRAINLKLWQSIDYPTWKIILFHHMWFSMSFQRIWRALLWVLRFCKSRVILTFMLIACLMLMPGRLQIYL